MPKRSRLGSVVWEYFIQKETDLTLAICQICQAEARRGKPGSTSKDFSTKGMWKHLEVSHKDVHSAATDERKSQEACKVKQKKLDEQNKAIYKLTDIFQVQGETSSKAATTKQMSIEDSFSMKLKYGPNHPDQQNSEQKLIFWMCDTLKPYNTVERDRFKAYSASLNKRFNVPSEKIIRTKLIPELNAKVQWFIKCTLDAHSASGGYFSITTDMSIIFIFHVHLIKK